MMKPLPDNVSDHIMAHMVMLTMLIMDRFGAMRQKKLSLLDKRLPSKVIVQPFHVLLFH
jgi:hypothetical protein